MGGKSKKLISVRTPQADSFWCVTALIYLLQVGRSKALTPSESGTDSRA
jgi:hypothetical protein